MSNVINLWPYAIDDYMALVKRFVLVYHCETLAKFNLHDVLQRNTGLVYAYAPSIQELCL